VLGSNLGVGGFFGEKIIWNFDNVQKAYAARGYEAKNGGFFGETMVLYSR
jgi:hypothetical protein